MDTRVLDLFNKKLILDYYFYKINLCYIYSLFDSGILLIIDLNKKKDKTKGGVNCICELCSYPGLLFLLNVRSLYH
jgi:hypothetical protein